MEKAFIFLAKHKDVAFATIEGDRPKIRVFQIMKRENNTLYFATAMSFCRTSCNGWKYFCESKRKSSF